METRLVLTALISAIVALAVGFLGGWFSYQAYLSASLSDIAAGIEEDAPEAGDQGEPVEEEPVAEESGDGVGAVAPEATGPSDGLFEYEIDGTDTVDAYKDEFCGETHQPSGERFIVLEITATNIGDGASMPAVDPGEVTGWTEDGRAFETSWDVCSFADEINPGTSTRYEVVFDVPKGTEFAVVQLSGYEAPDVAVIAAG
ncbi:hypothetical protein O4J56_20490 [Nocardiopsis sp. RSe5-2]|uniref:DUF4352 domain-containing protein n=1 Tax=Nocardiopsis endophytica TaxID=3018445 RepID=A0ABT4U8J0_9ACTN|nr:DUF4352 domain-containing protein [Nocardiopsis endophytica]MDA2813036.1 hypothetical protein [Nocardiopsis endophytica]